MLTLNRSVKTSLTIGLIQGLLLWLASTLTDPGVRVALATVVLVGGINLLLLGDNVRQRGTAWLVVGLTVVMAAISTWVFVDGDRQLFNNRWLTGSWTFFSLVIAYVCTVFILSWPTREGRYPRYEDLFRHAWDTVFIVLLGLLLWCFGGCCCCGATCSRCSGSWRSTGCFQPRGLFASVRQWCLPSA